MRAGPSAVLIATAAAIAFGPTSALAGTEEQNRAFLAKEIDLAKAKRLYLVLDPDANTLSVRIAGVDLRVFKLADARFGRARLAGGGAAEWPSISYELVSEKPEPDRPDVQIVKEDDPNAPPGDYLVTEREKMIASLPTTYRLQFTPALTVVVRGDALQQDFASRRRRFWFTLQEGWEGFRAWWHSEPIDDRLVLFMSPDESRRLFQVLQPKMTLLIQVPRS